MQSVLSRMWTHVTMSISYNDNHYITGTSNHPLKLFRIVEEWPQPLEKGASLANAIERINRNHPELEAFNGNISHNQPAPIICKDKIDNRIKPASN